MNDNRYDDLLAAFDEIEHGSPPSPELRRLRRLWEQFVRQYRPARLDEAREAEIRRNILRAYRQHFRTRHQRMGILCARLAAAILMFGCVLLLLGRPRSEPIPPSIIGNEITFAGERQFEQAARRLNRTIQRYAKQSIWDSPGKIDFQKEPEDENSKPLNTNGSSDSDSDGDFWTELVGRCAGRAA